MIYEIINPSDTVTFIADDSLVAQAATILLSGGQFGLCDSEGESYPTMMMFLGEEQSERRLGEIFGGDDAKSFIEFSKERIADIADALDTVAIVGFGGREDYDRRLAIAEDKDAYRLAWDRKNGTSLNGIASGAWSMAKEYRESIKKCPVEK